MFIVLLSNIDFIFHQKTTADKVRLSTRNQSAFFLISPTRTHFEPHRHTAVACCTYLLPAKSRTLQKCLILTYVILGLCVALWRFLCFTRGFKLHEDRTTYLKLITSAFKKIEIG